MTTRRDFIQMVSVSGVSLLAACSKKDAPDIGPAAEPSATTTTPPAAVAQVTPSSPTVTPATPTTPASRFPMLNPSEPAAVALGYVEDSSQANKAKYPNHAGSQACANCALFAGSAGDTAGPCPLFPGRRVNARGWCSGYNKKTT
jgi:hypothetical protein